MVIYALLDKKNSSYNSCSDIHTGRMGLYISGYEKATELLIKDVLDRDRNLDSLIYPIMYSYRHYLELCFKELSWLCKQVLKDKQNFIVEVKGQKRFEKYDNDIHGLSRLWQRVLSDLRQIDNNSPKNLVAQINKTVDDFQGIDSNGQSFRYPENKFWNDTLSDQKYINLISVAKNFLETRDRINQLICWVDSLIDVPCENPQV